MALQTLLAGRSPQELKILQKLLGRQPGIILKTRQIGNGHSDPLHGIDFKPDLLILNLSAGWEEELKAVAERPPASRPTMVVIGPGNDINIMRQAMRAGARDFLARPVPERELAELIKQVVKEQRVNAGGARCQLTAVMSAKGGAGATITACNLAHLLAVEAKQRTILLDLDIQFGLLPHYFDMQPKHSLLSVLDTVAEIDATALEGLVARHRSGLDLLGTMAEDQLTLPGEIPVDRLAMLMDLLAQGYQQVIVDLPHQIDPLTSMMLERADRVMVVVQQSLTHLREAKRLLHVLGDGLQIPRNQITVVVNRYAAKSKIRLVDIEDALGPISLEYIPNDFKNLETSVNLGVPLRDSAASAAITRSFAELALRLSGKATKKKTSRLASVFASFF